MFDKRQKVRIHLIKKKYQEIGSILCPAFNNERIYFRRKGFVHLLRKKGAWRPEAQRERKFHLLEYVSIIVETSTFFTKYRKEISNTGRQIQFWELSQRFADRIVCVIVQQIDNGSKCFLSIKDYKLKDIP